MANTVYRADTADAKKRRKRAGQYIKSLRLARDLTQSQLSKLLDLEYYTFISAVENGVNRVPPEALVDWAKALGIDAPTFTKTLLMYYDPFTHHALFPSEHEQKEDNTDDSQGDED